MERKRSKPKKTKVDGVWTDKTTMNVVGQAIRRLRLHRELTQEQLAAKCQVRGLNLTRGTLAKIEARLRFVKACELFIIAKVLRVSMEHFYPPGFGDHPTP